VAATAQDDPIGAANLQPIRGVGGKPNGSAVIRFSKPRPLLSEGRYRALLRNADWAWTKRYKRNQAKFVFDPPLDYDGPTYPGNLCALFPLGGKEGQPYASTGSKFYALWCETNGSAPTLPALTKAALKEMFEGRIFEIEVETVKRSSKAKQDEQDLAPELWYSVVRRFRLTSLSQKQPAQPRQPAQPVQPVQPGQPGNHPNPLTLEPIQPVNQATTKPPRFPRAREVDFGVTQSGSTTPGGTDEPTSNSVPRSQTCYVHGSKAVWWTRGADI
jgi:hypothetical protein